VWEGISELEAALKKVAADADLASKTIVSKSSAVIVAKARSNFSGTRKRVAHHYVPRGHTGGGYRPNVITGSLRRSIVADPITRYGTSSYGTIIAPRMIYSRRVELDDRYVFFGTVEMQTASEVQDIAASTWAKFLK
jgi:hypothetical protein